MTLRQGGDVTLVEPAQLPPPGPAAAHPALLNRRDQMDTPVEIVFHNMPSSPAVEQEIRDRVEKLDRMYNHLIGCRVSVEHLHRQHRTGNVYEVHIELRVPGEDVVVSREPHHARERYSDPDVNVALRDAFKTAERRLVEFKRKQRGDVKVHESDAFFVGQVSQLYPNEDHGFLLTHEGTQLYFHRNSLVQRDFDELQVGDRVHFVQMNRRHRPDRKQGLAGRGRAGLEDPLHRDCSVAPLLAMTSLLSLRAKRSNLVPATC